MTMSPPLRKFALTVHIAFSVGWMGAVAAYLVLDVAVATSQNAGVVRAAWIAMALIARYVIVPLALGSLLTGIIQSLGTKWGLFRHYWVLISLILTIFATLVLLVEVGTIRRISDIAVTSNDVPLALGNTLVHSVGGTVVLIVILVLNMYKPHGLTPYGWRKQQEARGRPHARSQEDRPLEISEEY